MGVLFGRIIRNAPGQILSLPAAGLWLTAAIVVLGHVLGRLLERNRFAVWRLADLCRRPRSASARPRF